MKKNIATVLERASEACGIRDIFGNDVHPENTSKSYLSLFGLSEPPSAESADSLPLFKTTERGYNG